MASYLDHFDNEEKGERKSGDNHEEGGDGQKVSTNAWSLFAHLPLLLLPRGHTIVPVHCWDCALAGLLLGTGGEVVSWDPPSRILGSWNWDPRILHPQGIRGGTIQTTTAAKVWQNQKYEEFITVGEKTAAGEDL